MSRQQGGGEGLPAELARVLVDFCSSYCRSSFGKWHFAFPGASDFAVQFSKCT